MSVSISTQLLNILILLSTQFHSWPRDMLFIPYKTQYIETMEVIYLVTFLKAPSVNIYSKRPSNVENVHLPLLINNCSRGINYPQCVDKDKANLFPFLVKSHKTLHGTNSWSLTTCTFGFFTNGQIWQYWHYFQLCYSHIFAVSIFICNICCW